MRFLPISLLIVLLTGCATVGSDKVALQPQNTKIVAVSLMGNQLKIRHVGTTIFSNAKHDLDVANWNIDQQIEDDADAFLQGGGKFVVVKPASMDYRDKFGVPKKSLWSGTIPLDHMKEGAQLVAKESGADLVVLVREAEYGDPFFGTNQQFSGYGIYQRSFFFSKQAINFVTMNVIVFDGKTGTSIAGTRQFTSGPREGMDWIEGEDLNLSKENEAKSKTNLFQLVQNLLKKSLVELKAVN